MSPTYDVIHTTSYRYDGEVSTSYGRANLAPTDTADQQVASHHLTITPTAELVRRHTDYFGNISTFFLIREPHTELAVTARSRVSVTRVAPDLAGLTALSLAEARTATGEAADAAEFLLASPRVTGSPELDRLAAEIFTGDRSFGAGIVELMRRIRQDFRYRSGATTVVSDIAELLRTRAGVCQDFAHLAVGCLRSAGLAARYVSGYLETMPAPGTVKLQGVDASHAWVSVFTPGLGWIDFDPTNDQFVDDRYVVAAVGRDYGDVPPLKGVIVSTATHSNLRVNVDVNRLSS